VTYAFTKSPAEEEHCRQGLKRQKWFIWSHLQYNMFSDVGSDIRAFSSSHRNQVV
jgi:hypothetical protein